MNRFNENKAVGQLTEILALQRGYTPAKARQIRNAAVLHDVGKEKIDSGILNKKGKLTEREAEVMKTHTVIGAKMLSSIQGELGEMARLICRTHHEWHDGRGYWSIPTQTLPEYLSFVAISDVFTALVAERPYKSAWPPEDALAFIQKQAGTQFCPELVKDFILLIRTDNRVPAIFSEVMNKNGDV
jgi:putative two-component system response regulator